jgi:hypothetical protein
MELKDLISKLSSYNLFTNLLPGILFVALLKEFTSFNLIFDPLFLGLFLYYFIGIVINRIGSLVVEPILIKIKFLTFIDYPKFVKASKMDAKIEILSENNNMCRSLVALCITLLLAIGYEWLMNKCTFIHTHSNVILIVSLFVIFLFSYRKQTKYVVKRCNANLDNE